MRFFHDSALPLPVDWYFVPDNRPVLPYETAFYGRQYEIDELPQEHLGEIYRPRAWRGGEVPRTVGVTGLCGSEKKWANGASAFDAVLDKWPGTLVPRCCGKPPIVAIAGLGAGYFFSAITLTAIGGVGVGGKSVVLPEVITECLDENPAPLQVTATWTFLHTDHDELDGRVETLTLGGDIVFGTGETNLWKNDGFDFNGSPWGLQITCNEGAVVILARVHYPGSSATPASGTLTVTSYVPFEANGTVDMTPIAGFLRYCGVQRAAASFGEASNE